MDMLRLRAARTGRWPVWAWLAPWPVLGLAAAWAWWPQGARPDAIAATVVSLPPPEGLPRGAAGPSLATSAPGEAALQDCPPGGHAALPRAQRDMLLETHLLGLTSSRTPGQAALAWALLAAGPPDDEAPEDEPEAGGTRHVALRLKALLALIKLARQGDPASAWWAEGLCAEESAWRPCQQWLSERRQSWPGQGSRWQAVLSGEQGPGAAWQAWRQAAAALPQHAGLRDARPLMQARMNALAQDDLNRWEGERPECLPSQGLCEAALHHAQALSGQMAAAIANPQPGGRQQHCTPEKDKPRRPSLHP